MPDDWRLWLLAAVGALVLWLLLFAPGAHALTLGVQDDGATPGTLCLSGQEVGARIQRIIAVPSDTNTAARIRAAHACGMQVILTIGGTGTRAPLLSASTLLRTIHRLPRVERYTVLNEPDLLNLKVCRYRAIWMRVRRVLGRRLMWGDYSPKRPGTHMLAAGACGRIPRDVEVAIHPYQASDPLLPGADEGALGNLRALGARLRQLGLHVHWRPDEFAYLYNGRYAVSDEQAAYMWPRALQAVARLGSPYLVIYAAQGPTWDSRPRELSWASLMGRPALPVPLPIAQPWDGA